MSYSFKTGKGKIKEYILNNYAPDANILDIGAGQGTYKDLLGDDFKNMDAVEIHAPYIEKFNLKEKYRNVYNINMLNLEIDKDEYDLIILGDVLEHVSVDDAQPLLHYLSYMAEEVIVAVPYELPQAGRKVASEKHEQDDLTHELFLERYPQMLGLFIYKSYGYYTSK